MYRLQSIEDYHHEYNQFLRDPEKFWEAIAAEFLWKKKWDRLIDYNFEQATFRFFDGATLNITENCLDRHLATRGEQVAIYFEANEPSEAMRSLSYQQLYERVCQTANALKAMGIQKSDRVCIYMSMIPELLISVLACARIGAVHSVVFAGFSAESLSGRIQDCQAKLIICNDSGFRASKEIRIKEIVDQALLKCPSIEHCLVYRHTGREISMKENRDIDWQYIVPNQETLCTAEAMASEDPLFILYTSGSTGQPKGLVHSIGGYMLYTAYSFLNVFQYDEGDVFCCTADIGWITGHSYIVYGPLLNGACQVLYEGVPNYPDAGRFWQICEKYKVNQFYTAPTAIRSLMAADFNAPSAFELKSLKVLGSVGEPINEEAWEWYFEKVGKKRCQIVDTWWQTETGGIMISTLGNITEMKACHATRPLPGILPILVDSNGNEIQGNPAEGQLCLKFPWPSIARTVYGDHDRFKRTYFSSFKNLYFTGDGAKRDENGFYRITGRVDDVVNVSGHRIGTAELEDAINEHEDIVESAVVAYPHEIKGQALSAFIIRLVDRKDILDLEKEINDLITQKIAAFYKVDRFLFVSALPKTRSGKIMRRILRKIVANEWDHFGDISTLLDPTVVDQIIADYKARYKV